MESILTVMIVVVLLIITIIIFKFNPKIDKVEDDYVISYIVHYSIKGKFGEVIRDYFILFKINKV